MQIVNQPQGKSIVYWIHRPCHTDIFTQGYVGISKLPVAERWSYHKRDAKRHNTPLANAIKKYQDITIKVIVITDTRKYCGEIEAKLRPEMGIGWNIASGGDTLKSDAGTEQSRITYAKRKQANAAQHWWKEEIKMLKQLTKDRIAKDRKQFRLDNPPHSKDRKRSVRNTSGYTGVNWYPKYNKYRVQIMHNRRLYCLGYYDSAKVGYEAYKKAKQGIKVGIAPY